MREEAKIIGLDGAFLLELLIEREPRHISGDDVRHLSPGIGVDHLRDPRATDSPQ